MGKILVLAEKPSVGRELAAKLDTKGITRAFIAMRGELGVGKTAFTRGFARYFGIEKGVSSPTFIIMHRYTGTEVINHYDLYRLNDYDELLDIGFEEQIESGISLIEWPDNFMEYLVMRPTVTNEQSPATVENCSYWNGK